MPFRFEALDPAKHDRVAFRCASPALTAYLQQQARKDAERHLAATFVMLEADVPAPPGRPARVIGYYTLSNYTVELTELPDALTRKLPRYPRLPATLIGRLARNVDFPGTADLILMDALARAYAQTKFSGSLAVVAEAKDDRALHFYHKHGFVQLGAEPNRVYLPMGAIKILLTPPN
jgi:hypothetical protein